MPLLGRSLAIDHIKGWRPQTTVSSSDVNSSQTGYDQVSWNPWYRAGWLLFKEPPKKWIRRQVLGMNCQIHMPCRHQPVPPTSYLITVQMSYWTDGIRTRQERPGCEMLGGTHFQGHARAESMLKSEFLSKICTLNSSFASLLFLALLLGGSFLCFYFPLPSLTSVLMVCLLLILVFLNIKIHSSSKNLSTGLQFLWRGSI